MFSFSIVSTFNQTYMHYIYACILLPSPTPSTLTIMPDRLSVGRNKNMPFAGLLVWRYSFGVVRDSQRIFRTFSNIWEAIRKHKFSSLAPSSRAKCYSFRSATYGHENHHSRAVLSLGVILLLDIIIRTILDSDAIFGRNELRAVIFGRFYALIPPLENTIYLCPRLQALYSQNICLQFVFITDMYYSLSRNESSKLAQRNSSGVMPNMNNPLATNSTHAANGSVCAHGQLDVHAKIVFSAKMRKIEPKSDARHNLEVFTFMHRCLCTRKKACMGIETHTLKMCPWQIFMWNTPGMSATGSILCHLNSAVHQSPWTQTALQCAKLR